MKHKLLAPVVTLLVLLVTLSSCYVETRPMYGGYGGGYGGRPHYRSHGGHHHGGHYHGGGYRGGYYRGR